MTQVFATFKGTTVGLIDAWYRTQALADAGATDADITAIQGEHTIDDTFKANKAYWDSTNILPEIPERVVFGAFSDVKKLKTTALTTYNALNTWYEALGKEGVVHSSAERNRALDYISYAFQWMYLVATNTRTTGQTDWTFAEREKAMEVLAEGPSNATTALAFYTNLPATAPTSPAGWVNVGTGTTVVIADTVATTTSMNLDSTKLPSFSLTDPSWIEGLTS